MIRVRNEFGGAGTKKFVFQCVYNVCIYSPA